MIMHDLNPEKENVCLLVHPMLSSAEGMKLCIVDNLGDGYRYLTPDLNGHGDAVTNEYHNAKEEAEEIHAYLIEHNISHLKLVFGASLGCVVLLQLMKYQDITFDHVFFEGASLFEDNDFLTGLLTKVFLFRRKQCVKHPDKAIKKMTKMYGEIAGEAMVRRFASVSEQSVRNIVHDCGHVEIPEFSPEIQSKMVLAYGEKDFDMKHARKIQPKRYPNAKFTIWPKYGHCERMSKDSLAYAEMLRKIIEE